MDAIILGKKIEMSSRFDSKGHRVPITVVAAGPCLVTKVMTNEVNRYSAVQVGLGKKKEIKIKKPEKGYIKNLPYAPKILREFRTEGSFEIGQEIKVNVFEPGDEVKITGVSKGKGFAGAMKRWGFHGGPKTHGQSDRSRAPGSIGSTTTPGRVLKGKKMAGHMGSDQVTMRGLTVFDVDEKNDLLMILGSVPGARGTILEIAKTGKVKNFKGLPKEETKDSKEEQKASDSKEPVDQPESQNEEEPKAEEKNETEKEETVESEPVRNASYSDAGGEK